MKYFVGLITVTYLLAKGSDCRHIIDPQAPESGLLKFTSELPSEETTNEKYSAAVVDSNSLANELINILMQLNEAISRSDNNSEQMLGDQPQTDANTGYGSPQVREKVISQAEIDKMHRIAEIEDLLLQYTGRKYHSGTNFTEKNRPQPYLPPSVPFISISQVIPRTEIIHPSCNRSPNGKTILEDNKLYLNFDVPITQSHLYSTIINTESIRLKLYKTNSKGDDVVKPKQQVGDTDESETESRQLHWEEMFSKSGVNASKRVIDAEVADSFVQQKLIRVSIYKIRSRNGKIENILLDSAMIPAVEERLTSWNVSRGINVWGNSTKKRLSLIVEVEDEKKRQLPAEQYFKIDCTDYNTRNIPHEFYKLTNSSHLAQGPDEPKVWLEVTTKEIPVREATFNGVSYSYNRRVAKKSMQGR